MKRATRYRTQYYVSANSVLGKEVSSGTVRPGTESIMITWPEVSLSHTVEWFADGRMLIDGKPIDNQ